MTKIREAGYVNDMVLYRNACEDRKLKFTLSQIDRLKEQYSRQQEKAKMYFAVQHLTVPSPTRRLLARERRKLNLPKQRSASAPVGDLQTNVHGEDNQPQRCRSLSERIKILDINIEELDIHDENGETNHVSQKQPINGEKNSPNASPRLSISGNESKTPVTSARGKDNKKSSFLLPTPSHNPTNSGWCDNKRPLPNNSSNIISKSILRSDIDAKGNNSNVAGKRNKDKIGITPGESRKSSVSFVSRSTNEPMKGEFPHECNRSGSKDLPDSPINIRRASQQTVSSKSREKNIDENTNNNNNGKYNASGNTRKITFFQRIMPPIEDWNIVPNLDEWYAKSPVKQTDVEKSSQLHRNNSGYEGQILSNHLRKHSSKETQNRAANSTVDPAAGGDLSQLKSKIDWEKILKKYATPESGPISKNEQRAKNQILREKWKANFKEMKSQRHSTFRAKVFDANNGENMTFVKFLPKNMQSMYIKDAQFAQRFL